MAKKMIFDALMSTEKGGLTVHLSLYSFIENKVTIIYCPALDISGYGLDEEEARKSFETIFSETTFERKEFSNYVFYYVNCLVVMSPSIKLYFCIFVNNFRRFCPFDFFRHFSTTIQFPLF